MSTITTTEQADALPTGFVLRLATGRVADRVPNGWTITGIYSPGPVPRGLDDTDLPATVLHDPAGRTEQAIRDDQRAEDLAMHLAFRPEVVAEIAVAVDDECSWDTIAAWCGGKVESGPDGTDSGEWDSWIVIPGVSEVAVRGTWIVQRHDLTFGVRIGVEGPSARSLAQVKAEALREAETFLRANMDEPHGDRAANHLAVLAHPYERGESR